MSAIKIDGRACAAALKRSLKTRVARLVATGRPVPALATVLATDDAGSVKYVQGKQQDCREVGIRPIDIRIPGASTGKIVDTVKDLDADPAVTGMIVQLPLPKGDNLMEVLSAIDPAKDMDGLTPANMGALALSINGPSNRPEPCTARGVVDLLRWAHVPLARRNVCIVGRGLTSGRPLALMLLRRDTNASVDVVHTGTSNLAAHIHAADIVISCAGAVHLISADMVQGGQILVDVGVTRGRTDPRTGKTHLIGDFDPACYRKVSAYVPTIGGVGPMTRAELLRNVLEAAERQGDSGPEVAL